LVICVGVIGLGTAPTLIAGFGLVDAIVPPASLTEGLTWIGTGLGINYGLNTAVSGRVADQHGAHLAFIGPVLSALAAAGLAVAVSVRLSASQSPVEVSI
jgi:sugar phosphate permease